MKAFILILASLSSLQSSGQWEISSEGGPKPRYINQVVNSKEGLLLFGGKHSNNNGFDDMWIWKDEQWKFLGNGATKRWDHTYVYVDNNDQLLLFGGRSYVDESGKTRVDLDDTWSFRNGSWEKLAVAGPQPRSSHAMACTQSKAQVILFGGRNGQAIYNDTWIFDGQRWFKSAANGPSARYGHTLAYDVVKDLVYLFGGYDGENLLNDLWTFDGEQWLELTTAVSPSARMAHSMTFDNQGSAILFGGWDATNKVSGEMWVWKDNGWTRQENSLQPQARLSGSLGFDRQKNEFVLFGGSSSFGDGFFSETWTLKKLK